MIKRKRITLGQSVAFIDAYQEIPIRFVEVDLKQTLALISKHRIYAYDAYLLECARQSNSCLFTLDQSLTYIAESNGIQVLEI